MQIHEITLNEAVPRAPVKTGLAQRAQARNAPVTPAQPATPAQPQLTPAQQLAQADQAELQARRQKAAQIPGAGPITQAVGNYIAQKIGPRGLPSQRAAAAAKAQPPVPQTNPVVTQQLQTTANKLNLPTQTTTVSSPPAQPAVATPAPAQQPAPTTAPVPKAVAPAKVFPPITIGAGPKATVYVNKGQGYVDSKTGKPIPPAILKAMGSVR